jgi:hypothetical protein
MDLTDEKNNVMREKGFRERERNRDKERERER